MNIIEKIKDGAEIKALSWRQPYGSLMLHGKIETRTWSSNYRGLVLICTSIRSYTIDKISRISGMKQFNRIIDTTTHLDLGGKNGMAIAIGRLIDCRPMVKEDEDKCFVKYYPDLYCHIYEDVTPIKPFPWKGKQGWMKVPEEIINKIVLL